MAGRIRGDQDRRVYSNGYDLSGYVRKIEYLKCEFEVSPDASITDGCKNVIGVGRAALGIGSLNTFFDDTADVGPHATHYGSGVKRVVMIPCGELAAPAQGNRVYCAELEQLGYQAVVEDGKLTTNIKFGDVDAVAAALAYARPWGKLLAPLAARTAVNTSTGVDGGAQTTRGGFLCYQISAWNGTGNITIKAQDADANLDGSFGDLSGATSGAIAHTAGHTAGIVALGTTATVKQFTRWQIVLGGGLTGATFALAFVRG